MMISYFELTGWRGWVMLPWWANRWPPRATAWFLSWGDNWHCLRVTDHATKRCHAHSMTTTRVCATCRMATKLLVVLGRRLRKEGVSVCWRIDRRTCRAHQGVISKRWRRMYAREAGAGTGTHLGHWDMRYCSSMVAAVQTWRAGQTLYERCRQTCSWRMNSGRAERQVTWKRRLAQWKSFHSKHSVQRSVVVVQRSFGEEILGAVRLDLAFQHLESFKAAKQC